MKAIIKDLEYNSSYRVEITQEQLAMFNWLSEKRLMSEDIVIDIVDDYEYKKI